MATTKLDLTNWSRRDQYHFFLDYEQPFFNICSKLPTGTFFQAIKEAGSSVFLATIHAALTAANRIQAFRLRIDGDEVVEHGVVHGAATIAAENDTFRFCWLDYIQDFYEFEKRSKILINDIKLGKGPLEPHSERTDVIHFSVLPWIHFTSLSHPRRLGTKDSVPKIVFGKLETTELPISIEMHHALADGVHAARYLEELQKIFLNAKSPSK